MQRWWLQSLEENRVYKNPKDKAKTRKSYVRFSYKNILISTMRLVETLLDTPWHSCLFRDELISKCGLEMVLEYLEGWRSHIAGVIHWMWNPTNLRFSPAKFTIFVLLSFSILYVYMFIFVYDIYISYRVKMNWGLVFYKLFVM